MRSQDFGYGVGASERGRPSHGFTVPSTLASRLPSGLNAALILISFPVETTYPRPSRQTSQALTISSQQGQPFLQLPSHARQV